jgi:hypothetical protein
MDNFAPNLNFIGKKSGDLTSSFVGYIDDLRIYDWDVFVLVPPHILLQACPSNCYCSSNLNPNPS